MGHALLNALVEYQRFKKLDNQREQCQISNILSKNPPSKVKKCMFLFAI